MKIPEARVGLMISFKAWGLTKLQGGGGGGVIPMSTLCGIECHKPSVTPSTILLRSN